eukprot:CCRYP_004397-RB/>CCRYP_004397-RB protein AED:0.08 eAED:0.08 QI:166/1/1/1/0.5/0.33/3/1306/370
MKVSQLIAVFTLKTAKAAANKRPSAHFIPSFIPSSKIISNNDGFTKSITSASDIPLFLRGGQQIQSRTNLRTHPILNESSLLFNVSPFFRYNSILGLINFLGMGISLAFPRMQYHLDLLGTGAFALASILTVWSAAYTFADLPLRMQVSSVAVVIWSVKLAGFLFFRACQVKDDKRLESLLSTAPGTITFWVLSFIWGFVSSLPHSLGLTSSLMGPNIYLLLGSIIFATGLLTESTADFQKWMWKQRHPGKFCNAGLWSISQHPNFFGNVLIWTGIAVMNAPALIQPIAFDDSSSIVTKAVTVVWSLRRAIMALLSLMFLWFFFNGQAQGVIGSGVQESLKRYGDDSNYQDYVDTVPLLVPDLRILFDKR